MKPLAMLPNLYAASQELGANSLKELTPVNSLRPRATAATLLFVGAVITIASLVELHFV